MDGKRTVFALALMLAIAAVALLVQGSVWIDCLRSQSLDFCWYVLR